MQFQNFLETDHVSVHDILRIDPGLYLQVVYGLLGVIACLAGFMLLVL